MMFRRSLLVALCALPFGLAHAAAVVGQPAPEFSVRDAEGKEVKLSQFRGKHVVLEWMNSGCPLVRKYYESGNMPATQKEAVGKGVVWLSVYSNDDEGWLYTKPAKLQEWARARGAVPTALLIDGNGALGKAYGARTTPHMYLVSPTGTLLYAGGIDSIASTDKDDIPKATNYVRQALGEALASKPVSVLRISGLLDTRFDTVDIVFGTSFNELHRPPCLEPPRPTDCLKRLAIRRPPAIPS